MAKKYILDGQCMVHVIREVLSHFQPNVDNAHGPGFLYSKKVGLNHPFLQLNTIFVISTRRCG